MKRRDLLAQGFNGTAILDYVVCRGEAPGARRLRRHDGADLRLRQAAAAAYALDLQFLRSVDHQHAVDAAAIVGRLDEQRHDVDHIGPRRASDEPARLLANHGMQQRLECLLRLGVGEHPLAHLVAVQRARRCDDFASKYFSNFGHCCTAGRGELVRDGVGVDHARAQALELGGRGALAAADAAGEAHYEAHPKGRSMGKRRAISLPQKSAIRPATAMYGPKWNLNFQSQPRRAANIWKVPNARPANDDRRITMKSSRQPRKAATAAVILKSPYPIPSTPRTARKIAFTVHSTMYPASAPMTASASGTNAPARLTSRPSHISGSVMSSGR